MPEEEANTRERPKKLDNMHLETCIRKYISNRNKTGMGVTVDAVVQFLKEERPHQAESFNRFCVSKLLKRMGYRRCKGDKKHPMRESTSTQAKRSSFLQRWHDLWNEIPSRHFVFIDETAVHRNEAVSHSWFVGKDKTITQVVGSGPRLIVVGAGTEFGWVEGAQVVFQGAKLGGSSLLRTRELVAEVYAGVVSPWDWAGYVRKVARHAQEDYDAEQAMLVTGMHPSWDGRVFDLATSSEDEDFSE